MIIVPQLLVEDAVRKLLSILRKDLLNKPWQETILYTLWSETDRFGVEYAEEVRDLFSRKEGENSRFIDVRLSFDAERANIPTIHVTVPTDEEKAPFLGNNQNGYGGETLSNGSEYRDMYSRMFTARVSLVITSDNAHECMLIYETIRALLISIIPVITLGGFENARLSGQDLMLNQDLVPPNIFIRSISLTGDYLIKVPDIVTRQIGLSLLNVVGTPKESL